LFDTDISPNYIPNTVYLGINMADIRKIIAFGHNEKDNLGKRSQLWVFDLGISSNSPYFSVHFHTKIMQ